MPQLTQRDQDEATRINRYLEEHVNRVRSNGDLTTEGRRRQIAGYYDEAEAEMAQLRRRFEGDVVSTSRDLSRELFGSTGMVGVDAISARDADDRAARIDSADEATALLSRAEENGDEVLARSIAQHAFSQMGSAFGPSIWGPVLDAYAERRPAVAAKMVELIQARQDSLKQAIQRGFLFHVPKPSELEGLGPSELTALRNP